MDRSDVIVHDICEISENTIRFKPLSDMGHRRTLWENRIDGVNIIHNKMVAWTILFNGEWSDEDEDDIVNTLEMLVEFNL